MRRYLNALVALAIVASVHGVAAAADPVAASRPRPPNVVVILADDLGFGDLGCFDQKLLKTPAIDAMAAEGMRFTQFYAGGATDAPSRHVLLTGRHAGHLAVGDDPSRPLPLPAGMPTVASVLKAAGYATACVGKWGVGAAADLTNPNDVGFDHFYGYVDAAHAQNPWSEFLIRDGKPVRLRNEVGPRWKDEQNPAKPGAGRGVADKRVDYAPTLILDDALRFVREKHAGPFFLLLSHRGTAANAEGGQRGMEVDDVGEFGAKDWPDAEKAYAAAVRNLDRDVGRVLAVLKELKVERDTLVIVTSDNGPHAEGGHATDFFDSNWKFRGGKGELAEGGIRVPMIAWWPGTVPAGGANDRQWYAGDLLATAAELAGVKPPVGTDGDGLVTALRGQVNPDRWARKGRLFWETREGPTAEAVRFGKWKAIRSPAVTGPVALYDMSNDFGEKRDYAPRRLDLAKHATNLLNASRQPDATKN